MLEHLFLLVPCSKDKNEALCRNNQSTCSSPAGIPRFRSLVGRSLLLSYVSPKPHKMNRPQFADWDETANSITQAFLRLSTRTDIVSLAGGLPAKELYPIEAVRDASQRALDNFGSNALEYGPSEGLFELRLAIAERMSRATDRGCFTVENVLLTTGAMQALDLLGKILIGRPEEVIVAQFPTYLGALDAWRPRRPAYRSLDWNADQATLVDAFKGAKFVYSVPNYSNPTGELVSTERRKTLLAAVREANQWLIEDDPYEPLQLDGPSGPSLLQLDVQDRSKNTPYDGPVLYLGTLSKSLVPGLRVGWAVGCPAIIRQLALAKSSADLSSSAFAQTVAYELLRANVEKEHVPKIKAAYTERRDGMLRTLESHLSHYFEWNRPPGGMFCWVRAKPETGIDTDELYDYAVEAGVAFVPSSVFDPKGALRSAMRLNFSRNKPEMIEEGLKRLARAVDKYLEAKRTGTLGKSTVKHVSSLGVAEVDEA